MRHESIEVPGAGVVLRSASEDDFKALRKLFDEPDVYELWGGEPLTDEEIVRKYLGRSSTGAGSPSIPMYPTRGASTSGQRSGSGPSVSLTTVRSAGPTG